MSQSTSSMSPSIAREEAIIHLLKSNPTKKYTPQMIKDELKLQGYSIKKLTPKKFKENPLMKCEAGQDGDVLKITLSEKYYERLTQEGSGSVELDSITLVDDNSSLAYASHIISSSGTIAVSCESENIGKTGELCLVAIGCDKNQFLFDVLDSNPVQSEVLHLLKEWFEDEKKVKVFHYWRHSSSALYSQFNIKLRCVLDTQVMDKFVNGGKKPVVGLSELCTQYGIRVNPYKQQLKQFFKNNRTYGKERPLIPQMKMNAAHDVMSLIEISKAMLDGVDAPLMKKMHDASHSSIILFEESAKKKRPIIETPIREVPKANPITLPQAKSIVLLQTNSNTVSTANPVVIPQSNLSSDENTSIQQCIAPIVVDEVDHLLNLLPEDIRMCIAALPSEVEEIVEIAMDVQRPYQVFYYGRKRESFGTVTFEHLNHVAEQLEFGSDNRSGIDGTLHRISSMKNRGGEINGLTLRVGRAVMNIAARLSDIIEKTESILLLGHPGTGKTTIMRDIARVMSEKDRVMIVDTSCEIGGFGDTPHQAIGKARRMQVPDIRMQQEVMIQAVQNHTPDVIVIDEIGTSNEVLTARTIAQRGVVLCASAHGNMQSIMKNPILCNLLGGVETVIIGDAAALQHDNKKVHTQMKDTPIFENIIELSKEDLNSWKIYRDIPSVVKKILAGKSYQYELRSFDPNTNTMTKRIETVDPLAPQIK